MPFAKPLLQKERECMKEIRITSLEENQRLDKFLMKYMNTAPKSFFYKMLRKKRIKLNAKKAEGKEILTAGDVIQFYLSEETMSEFMEEKKLVLCERHFGIVYEDDLVLILNKPPGALTHPEKATDTDTLVQQMLSYLYEKGEYLPEKSSSFTPALCNRLDRNTSGLIIAGKTLAAVQAINLAIAEHKTEKYYYTMVKGKLDQQECQEIYGWHSKEKTGNQVKIYPTEQKDAKKVVTRFWPKAVSDQYTFLEIQLVTGKSHQIRAHLASIGHPIVGDRKYGQESVNRIFRQKYALSNQFLHAGRFVWRQEEGALAYLKNQEWMAPLPSVFQRICQEEFHLEKF